MVEVVAFNLTLNAAIKSDLTEIHPLLEQKKKRTDDQSFFFRKNQRV